MIAAYGKGLLMGMGMSLMLGTVFFSLIQTSIQHGWRKGILIALGVVVSDIIFISLAVFGISFISKDSGNIWMEVAALVVLLFLGISLISGKETKIVYPKTRFGKALIYFTNGFLLNGTNPVNFFFWVGLAGMGRTSWGYSTEMLVVFFAGCLSSIFLMELLIAYLADKIKRFLNEKVMLWINRVTGIIFLLAALAILIKWMGVELW